MKRERGITLIALVITIIVLIILAGVTIATLSGPNGILTKANEAKKRTEQASKEEQARLLDMEDLINDQGKAIFNEKQGVNEPKVSQGMIPIKYENGKWVVTNENDEQWYNYVNQANGVDGQSKWANVMLSDGTYKAENVEVGQVIEEDELGSMFVWIPRYSYQITSGYHNDRTGKIDVKFLKGRTNQTIDNVTIVEYNEITTENYTNFPNGYVVHPAFTYGEDELTGIWVAKFEASSTTTTPDENYGGGNVTDLLIKVLPNKQSWRNISIGNCFTNCINMNSQTNANYYGISFDDKTIDPHLMKNTEWGAVVYLTQSSYGRNGNEVTPNTNGYASAKYIYTGYAGNAVSTGNPWEATTPPTNVFFYHTENGVKASTTGNQTGIYDLSGGSWESVAAYVDNRNDVLNGLGGELYRTNNIKYKDIYESGERQESTEDECSVANYAKAKKQFGDVIWETSDSGTGASTWFNNFSVFPGKEGPFFYRSGAYMNGGYTGIYFFEPNRGSGGITTSFRPVVTVY